MICSSTPVAPRRRARPFVAAGALLLLATAAVAQTAVPETVEQRDKELQATREEQRKAAETQAALAREIDAIGADRRKLRQDLLDTAARMRGLDEKIAATEAGLKPLDEDERRIKQSLQGRRAVIAEVLAALQRVGRRPPPALLIAPEDALASVRSAIMLGAVLPEMRNEAEQLAGELADLVRVRKDIAAERDKLQRDLAELPKEQERLTLLIETRQRAQTETEKALDAERSRASALAKQADSLQSLIATLEKNLDSATRGAREAARLDSRPALAAFRDPGRLAPAASFVSLRGQVPKPVNGTKLRDYGANDGAGSTERGLTLATRPGAQVTAPIDGWVVYAGPFRSYGQLLILNAGGGYHILLAGMERISVDLGQFVLTGEPVASMGSGSQIASVIATGTTQPALYVEFRKDGIPVDPSPWWATSEGEKVRG